MAIKKDNEWLKKQFPFPLVPTNMEDVYTIPPLPEDLDLRTASDATLANLGLFLRRPKAGDHPRIVAAWEKIYERGLRIVTPHIEPLPARQRMKRQLPGPNLIKPRHRTVTTPNFCGGDLPTVGWQSVTGLFSLPYLSVPPAGLGNLPPSQLAAWVGVSGQQFLQTGVQFLLNTNVNPPATIFFAAFWQWWSTSPTDPTVEYQYLPGSGQLSPLPAMKSGDLVQFYAAYFNAPNGSGWGNIYFLFYNDLESGLEPDPWLPGVTLTRQTPTLFTQFIPAPTGALLQGTDAQWLMENVSVTDAGNQFTTTTPVFSGSPGSITPVTFTSAAACLGLFTPIIYEGSKPAVDITELPLRIPALEIPAGGPVGYPGQGFAYGLEDANGNTLSSVTLNGDTVSILYTG